MGDYLVKKIIKIQVNLFISSTKRDIIQNEILKKIDIVCTN